MTFQGHSPAHYPPHRGAQPPASPRIDMMQPILPSPQTCGVVQAAGLHTPLDARWYLPPGPACPRRRNGTARPVPLAYLSGRRAPAAGPAHCVLAHGLRALRPRGRLVQPPPSHFPHHGRAKACSVWAAGEEERVCLCVSAIKASPGERVVAPGFPRTKGPPAPAGPESSGGAGQKCLEGPGRGHSAAAIGAAESEVPPGVHAEGGCTHGQRFPPRCRSPPGCLKIR